MPNENQLIDEYETALDSTIGGFYGEAFPDLAAMRDDVDPRAVAMHWLDGLMQEDGHERIIKALALQQLRSDAEELLKLLPKVNGSKDTPEQEAELKRLVAAGADHVCYKGGEIYPAEDFRV